MFYELERNYSCCTNVRDTNKHVVLFILNFASYFILIGQIKHSATILKSANYHILPKTLRNKDNLPNPGWPANFLNRTCNDKETFNKLDPI